ncbi:MAG: helix-turn-helix transcriptional regulator [Salinivirgaceae bacterium]|nr:helix-turn-helix transcriptional regulator [Salinivirgaceae bacterium]
MDTILEINNPTYLLETIASNMRRRRLDLNLTQVSLARLSGVSLGSIKRYETNAEISLKSLVNLAIALKCPHPFTYLFVVHTPDKIDDIVKQQRVKPRQRARNND